MLNSISKADDFIKNINALSKTDDFTKTYKLINKKYIIL